MCLVVKRICGCLVSQATNAAAFDVENRVWPRPNDPNFRASFSGSGGQQKLIPDYFIVFPPCSPLRAADLAQPMANPANDTLYRYPNEYLYSEQRPQAIYRLMVSYQSDGGGDTQSIRLSTIQVRQNSERVALDDRMLQREIDYQIDYDLGIITFTRPDTLFMRPRQVSVRYEENPLFTTAPTTILGFASQLQLDKGQIAFTAISQQQRSNLNRPPLGFEPVGSLVAGVTSALQWDASALTNAIGRIPFARTTSPSRVSLQAEFAMSKPRPNAAGRPTSRASRATPNAACHCSNRPGTSVPCLHWVRRSPAPACRYSPTRAPRRWPIRTTASISRATSRSSPSSRSIRPCASWAVVCNKRSNCCG